MPEDFTPAPPPPAPKGRKYTYLGKPVSNPKVVMHADNIKIKPWSMTDDQIDKLLSHRPDLARLWKVNH